MLIRAVFPEKEVVMSLKFNSLAALLILLTDGAKAADLSFSKGGFDQNSAQALQAITLVNNLKEQGAGSLVLLHAPGVSERVAQRRRKAFTELLEQHGLQPWELGPLPTRPSEQIDDPSLLSVRAQIDLESCSADRRLYLELDAAALGPSLHGEGRNQAMIIEFRGAVAVFNAAQGLQLSNLGIGEMQIALIERLSVAGIKRNEWMFGRAAQELRVVRDGERTGEINVSSRQLGVPDVPDDNPQFPVPPDRTAEPQTVQYAALCSATINLPL